MEDVAAGCLAQRVLEDLLYLKIRRGTQVAQGRGLQNLHSWVRIPPAPPTLPMYSAEIYFLFENADPSAVGNQSCPIVERIGEFSEAPILPRGSLINFAGVLHIESFMRALVVKHLNEGIELGLLLKEVGTGWPGSFHL